MQTTPATPAAPAAPIRLYRSALSGHAHRVQLMLSLLGLPYSMVDVDMRGGEHKRLPYLAMNPFGQVPLIDDNGTVLYDSNAILWYLARTYGGERWLPSDIATQSVIMQWLSMAAGPVFNGPCAARLIRLFGAPLDPVRAAAIADKLFEVLEQHFAQAPFAIGEHASVADVAVYSYVAHADEGGLDLAPYPAIRAWLARVEALPGFVPMRRSAPAA